MLRRQKHVLSQSTTLFVCFFLIFECFDERQITHLICARLNMIYMTFSGGVFGAFIQEKERKQAPKHPLKKSYRSYFRRAQIR